MFTSRTTILSALISASIFIFVVYRQANPLITAANKEVEAPRAIAQDDPHNVLLLIADDYGVDMAALYNNGASDLPPTPNIDALFNTGVLFENAWTTPICTPTRAAMVTGRYGFRTGVGDLLAPSDDGLLISEMILPEAISNGSTEGYTHANIGKWHLSTQQNGGRFSPTNAGYDHFSGLLSGALDNYDVYRKVTNGTAITSTVYATTDTVNDAIDWLDTQNNADKPWFLWVAFNAPHSPFHLPPTDLHSFDTLSTDPVDIDNDPYPYYKAMVESMDSEIGRLISSIPADELDNTTIIFIGDNGSPGQVVQAPATRQHAKGTLYQGGIHVPLIISSPGVVNPGRQSSALVNSVDVYSTVLDLMDIDIASTLPNTITLDSVSMVPYLLDQTHPAPRDWIYAELFDIDDVEDDHGRTIRDERYKLILFENGTTEFYDLETDELETDDRLSDVDGLSEEEERSYCTLYEHMIDLIGSESGQTAPTLPTSCDLILQATQTPSATATPLLTPSATATSTSTPLVTETPAMTMTPALDKFSFIPYSPSE